MQTYFGPRPPTPPPHSSKPTAIDEPYYVYDPWVETNEQNHSEQSNNETYQDCNCVTNHMFDLNEKHLNIPECEQFGRQFFNHEFKYEQFDSFGESHDHSHHSDQSNTSIMNTSLPYCPHLQQRRRSSDPGVCESDGAGGGGSLLWQRSSRQDSFSQPSVSAPVVVVSQSTWEPTHSQSSIASHSQQHEILLSYVSNQMVSGLIESVMYIIVILILKTVNLLV